MQVSRAFGLPLPRLLILILLLMVSVLAGSPAAAGVQALAEQVTEQSSSSAASSSSAQAQSSEKSVPMKLDVNDVIDVKGVANSWERAVNELLAKFGFSANWSAQAFASAVVAIVAVIVIALIRLGTRKLYNKLKARTRTRGNLKRIKLYQRLTNLVLILLALLLASIALFVIWWGGSTNIDLAQTATGWFARLLSFSIALIFVVVIFELIVTATERYFYRLASKGSARINTLLPIVRNIIYGALVVIFGITLISELGIDVTPLLASAGVIGVAVGFGAQALIKDVINGFILVLEDLVQVGDVASVAGKTGIVEKITLRKIQLRDLDGRVYTVPCSEISVIENLTKEFSYYMFNVGVAYRESPDEVIEVLKEIGAQMQTEDEYKELILDPIEVLGVDQFADSAIVIKARIKTIPIRQWLVGREFNRRMKYAFDERNIEIPFPHQTVYFGEDKNGQAPPAHFLVERAGEPANDSADDHR